MARTFTEAEAQRIFARIAERQQTAASAEDHLSLDDLEEAARAAGLDPALVAGAVAELDMPAPRRGFLGAPTEVVRQRMVRGPVSDEAWEAMVAAARAEFGQSGVAGQVGRMREWTITGGGRRQTNTTTRLSLEPSGQDTRIVLTQSARHAAVGFTIAGAIQALMAAGFGIAAFIGVDPGLWIPVVMMSAMAVLFLGGSQVGLRLWERRQSRRFDAVLDRLDLLARDSAPHDAAPRDATTGDAEHSAGRINPALLDDEAPEPGSDDARTRTRA